MCLFISPNHFQKLAYDLSLKFNFIMSVPNLLRPMGLQLHVWCTCLSLAEITQWGCLPQWWIRAVEEGIALFQALPCSKAFDPWPPIIVWQSASDCCKPSLAVQSANLPLPSFSVNTAPTRRFRPTPLHWLTHFFWRPLRTSDRSVAAFSSFSSGLFREKTSHPASQGLLGESFVLSLCSQTPSEWLC